MRTFALGTICLLAALMPLATAAQTNIKKSFDKLLDNSEVTYTENHSMEQDVSTGVKESQSDVYRFSMPKSGMNLIEAIEKAFKLDADKAYSTNSGIKSASDPQIQLAVGDDNINGVSITSPDGCHYTYSTFLASPQEDTQGIYRYAYGMNWIEKDGKITGLLAVTYATTLKYRQEKNRQERWTTLDRLLNTDAASAASGKQSWFASFMQYVQGMATTNATTRKALATAIYEHTRDVEKAIDVTPTDIETARTIIKVLMTDNRYQDPVLQQLFSSTLRNLNE